MLRRMPLRMRDTEPSILLSSVLILYNVGEALSLIFPNLSSISPIRFKTWGKTLILSVSWCRVGYKKLAFSEVASLLSVRDKKATTSIMALSER